MHKLNCDGAFTDGRGASFYGVIADVAGDKDTGNASLEQIRVAIECPGLGRVGFQIGTGEDKAFIVEGDFLGKPVSLGSGADKDEQGGDGTGLFSARGLQGQTFEMA